jgi:hypothetical protein
MRRICVRRPTLGGMSGSPNERTPNGRKYSTVASEEELELLPPPPPLPPPELEELVVAVLRASMGDAAIHRPMMRRLPMEMGIGTP